MSVSPLSFACPVTPEAFRHTRPQSVHSVPKAVRGDRLAPGDLARLHVPASAAVTCLHGTEALAHGI